MFETCDTHTIYRMPAPAPAAGRPAIIYAGPDRRGRGGDAGAWWQGMLDEIDYGLLVVGSDGQVIYMNHAARLELDDGHPLHVLGHALCAQRAQDVAPLLDALGAAQRGLRRLLRLGTGARRVSISVVPLRQGPRPASAATLLVLGKRQLCSALSVQAYAGSVGLTAAETRVLELLCGGARPTAVAAQLGVALSTVRTQIASIRAKTGVASLRELVQLVAVLPPLVGALRSVG
jgi:DNA-binding CsgD family transcriptional regulator